MRTSSSAGTTRGKSNVLRALNLFFNNETNPGQPFLFERDFAHARLAEAQERETEVRKFVYVKVWFVTPENWLKSLGPLFWVRKQWSITRQADPIVDTSVKDSARQQYLTRFLNKIRFHYIPAIKDRRIFEKLLAEIYDVVANEQEFLSSLDAFSQELKERTQALSTSLFENLSLSSVISPPTDLSDLFRSLDFETGSEHGDSYSLTLQRGDGLQVRHIPAILAFVSDRSSYDFHIWGFEEPENSLELASAIDEAEQFRKYGLEQNKQVFLTSHSPAFFSLDTEGVVRFFVSRAELVAGAGRTCSKLLRIAKDGQSPSELMGETPHLPVISMYLRDADKRLAELQEAKVELETALESASRSMLYLEGVSDVKVVEGAWTLLVGESPPFDLVVGSGTRKMESLAQDGAVFSRVAPGRDIFVLVDNDSEGRRLYGNARLDGGARWVRHNSNGTYWCRLPWTDEFFAIMRKLGVPKSHWPGCLENVFPAGLRREAILDGALEMSDEPYSELLEHFRKIKRAVYAKESDEHLYVMVPSHSRKEAFADWIVDIFKKRPEVLEPLRSVVEGLKTTIEAGA